MNENWKKEFEENKHVWWIRELVPDVSFEEMENLISSLLSSRAQKTREEDLEIVRNLLNRADEMGEVEQSGALQKVEGEIKKKMER